MKNVSELSHVEWQLYEKDFLEVILSQSDKMLEETSISFRQLTERSYWLFTFMAGILSYSLSEVLKLENKLYYSIAMIGMSIGMAVLIIFNLFPAKKTGAGGEPKDFLGNPYEGMTDAGDKLKTLYAAKIDYNQRSITFNDQLNGRRIAAFKIAFYVGIVTVSIILCLQIRPFLLSAL